MGGTGATPEQIEAAVERNLADTSWDDIAKRAFRMSVQNDMTMAAKYLIPPDHRIIGPEHLTAIRFAAAVIDQMIDDAMFGETYPVEQLDGVLLIHPNNEGYQGHYDTLAALIGDADAPTQ